MEEDEATPKALPDWVELEYKVSDARSHANNDSRFQSAPVQHMRTLAGSGSEVHFTHLSKACGDSLMKSLGQPSEENQSAEAFCYTKDVLDLIKEFGVSLDQVCLLDPKAEHELSPDDGYANFLFGVGCRSVNLSPSN